MNDLESANNIEANVQIQCAAAVRQHLREWISGRLFDDLSSEDLLEHLTSLSQTSTVFDSTKM